MAHRKMARLSGWRRRVGERWHRGRDIETCHFSLTPISAETFQKSISVSGRLASALSCAGALWKRRQAPCPLTRPAPESTARSSSAPHRPTKCSRSRSTEKISLRPMPRVVIWHQPPSTVCLIFLSMFRMLQKRPLQNKLVCLDVAMRPLFSPPPPPERERASNGRQPPSALKRERE